MFRFLMLAKTIDTNAIENTSSNTANETDIKLVKPLPVCGTSQFGKGVNNYSEHNVNQSNIDDDEKDGEKCRP
jgi:hypothetical protein